MPFNCPLQVQVPPHDGDDDEELELLEDEDELDELLELLEELELDDDELLLDDDELELDDDDELLGSPTQSVVASWSAAVGGSKGCLHWQILLQLLLDISQIQPPMPSDAETQSHMPHVVATGVKHGSHSHPSAENPSSLRSQRLNALTGLAHAAENPGSERKIGIDI